jgi:hypothetical protein
MTGILIRQKVPTPCIKGGFEETIELHETKKKQTKALEY